VLIVSALGLSSFHFNRDSANRLRARVINDIGSNIYEEVVRLVDIARGQDAYDRDRIQSGAVAAADFPGLVESWERPMNTHDELAFLAISLDGGPTLRMGRSPTGSIYIQEWRPDFQKKEVELKIYHPEDYPDGKPFSMTTKPLDDIQ